MPRQPDVPNFMLLMFLSLKCFIAHPHPCPPLEGEGDFLSIRERTETSLMDVSGEGGVNFPTFAIQVSFLCILLQGLWPSPLLLLQLQHGNMADPDLGML